MPPPGNKALDLALVDDSEGTMMVDTGIIELLISGRSNSEHEYAKSEGFPLSALFGFPQSQDSNFLVRYWTL